MKLDIKTIGFGIALLLCGTLIGFTLNSSNEETAMDQTDLADHEHTEQVYTCSMHPQIRQNEPGKCPLCSMALIPLVDDINMNSKGIRMSSAAVQLASIQTSVVGTGITNKEISLSGKVKADEQRVFTQTAHIGGRIEKLFVNTTGEKISKGQSIAHLYSPDLVTAQNELKEAMAMRNTQPALYEAVKKKLGNWKLSDKQIDELAQSDQGIESFPILANLNGYILTKYVNLGDHVMIGSPLFKVVDLSKIWVVFDIYESDIGSVKKYDNVSVTFQSLPGEEFNGQINFIDPVLDAESRTAKARVTLDNRDQRLKPEMFATGILKSQRKNDSETISVPKSAVLWTGRRSIVYVKTNNESYVSFNLREVTLGKIVGDNYIINEGLETGEEIATNGTFSIDAAAQLAGLPSMMNPEGGKVSTGYGHGAMLESTNVSEEMTMSVDENFKKQLASVYKTQLVMQEGFIATDSKTVTLAVEKVEASLKKVNMSLIKGEMHEHWMTSLGALNSTLKVIKASEEIEAQRLAYSDFNDALYLAIKMFGISGETIYYQFCPMAKNNTGAYWLSSTKEVVNPYFGNVMLSCGENKETIN